MIPYIDTGLLACLLFETPGSALAWNTVAGFTPPFAITFLHQLQIENLLVRSQTEGAPAQRAAALDTAQLWRNYLDEGVFAVRSVDWDGAFRVAISWNGEFTRKVPPALLLLHPALAAALRATHFLSFDPRSRSVAKAAGLRVLPERL